MMTLREGLGASPMIVHLRASVTYSSGSAAPLFAWRLGTLRVRRRHRLHLARQRAAYRAVPWPLGLLRHRFFAADVIVKVVTVFDMTIFENSLTSSRLSESSRRRKCGHARAAAEVSG